MNIFNIVKTVAVASSVAFVFANNALAQSTVLVVDQARVIQTSDVGQHVSRQVVSIGKQMDAEVKAQLAPITTERDKLMVELKNMSVEALKARPDLQQRAKTYQEGQQKVELEIKYKQTELQITEKKALQKISVSLEAILKAIIDEKKADILLDRSAVIYTSATADITDEVLSRLNAQLQTVPVVRERMPRKPLPPQQASRPAQ